MFSNVQTVTPEIAQEWLDKRNYNNRAVRPRLVRSLTEQIKAGRFQLTHQGIAFSSTGRLLDGQHRLAAIVAAGISVPLVVTNDLGERTFLAIDQGARKSSADIFGYEKKDLEVVRAAATLVRGTTVSQADVEDFIPNIRPLAEKLRTASGTTVRTLSCASTKLGAVVRILEGEDAEYVYSIYASLVNERLTELPIVGQQFVLACSKGSIRAGDKNLTMAKAMWVFNKALADKKYFHIRDLEVYIQRAKEVLTVGV